MTLRRSYLGTVALACAGLVAAVVLAFEFASGDQSRPRAGGLAAAEARRFLSAYVEPTGRVVRTDQGGDTVSEGQSYALLLAEGVGDDGTFRRVWQWTATHLLEPSGLLASHADASDVIDAQPAADADLVTAWALALAGERGGAGAASYRRAARSIAAAVLARETLSRGGRPVLAAGPWATGSPASLNPSYWVLPAFAELYRATNDPRWAALSGASLANLHSLSRGGLLPPDWARLDGATISATPSPNGQPRAVQYGLDAQRLVVWFASSCDPEARRLAAGWWPKLSGAAGQALALGTDGRIVVDGPSPLALIAAAAAANAAGHGAAGNRLLAQADVVEQHRPSYYGAAWVALGRALLDGPGLDGCHGGPA
jgi:endoglucanase